MVVDKKIEIIAEIVHQINKGYCKSIGDVSQVDWKDAPDWQKNSMKAGVKFVLENPNSTPKDQHEEWFYFKLKDGWCYGEVKDIEKKTHPSMVAYKDLPTEQKAKDYISRSTIEIVNEMIDRYFCKCD